MANEKKRKKGYLLETYVQSDDQISQINYSYRAFKIVCLLSGYRQTTFKQTNKLS